MNIDSKKACIALDIAIFINKRLCEIGNVMSYVIVLSPPRSSTIPETSSIIPKNAFDMTQLTSIKSPL